MHIKLKLNWDFSSDFQSYGLLNMKCYLPPPKHPTTPNLLLFTCKLYVLYTCEKEI